MLACGLQAHEVDLLRSLGDMVMMELELRRRTSLQQTLCSLPSSLRVRKALQRLSHELRTPLHCISGSMELVLGMGDLSASARECVQVRARVGGACLPGGCCGFVWILVQGCTTQVQQRNGILCSSRRCRGYHDGTSGCE